MIRKEKNILAKLGQCQYGLWIKDKSGWLRAKEPTKPLANSPCVAQQLARRCPGKHTHADGRHATLFDGRSKQPKYIRKHHAMPYAGASETNLSKIAKSSSYQPSSQ